jgi:hypothetical protein
MTEARTLAPAGDRYSRRRHIGETSGRLEFGIDLATDDGWTFAEDLEFRCRYAVRFGRREILTAPPVDPPEPDEVTEIDDFEILCRKRNPERGVEPLTLMEWRPVPADIMARLTKWMETGKLDELIIEDARS